MSESSPTPFTSVEASLAVSERSAGERANFVLVEEELALAAASARASRQ
jgi:hypothetical protein